MTELIILMQQDQLEVVSALLLACKFSFVSRHPGFSPDASSYPDNCDIMPRMHISV